MKVIETELPGVVILEPRVFGDERGFFMETWNEERYEKAGLQARFVQDNLSFSRAGVLRGLHFQNPNAQGKLIQVLQGEVFDVAVDVRRGSPTFGRSVGVMLTADSRQQFYVPPGFAHGFCVFSETALFFYKCTDLYNPEAEVSVRWNDPRIGIDWPVSEPSLSEKDRNAALLDEIPQHRLPPYGQG